MATPKTPYFLDVGGNRVVLIKLVKSSYSAGLVTALGMVEGTSDEVPQGKILVGTGRLAALQNGCFGLSVVYAFSGTVKRKAKVLCAPGKADTIFTEAHNHTYRGKNILEAEIPKRRVYVI